MFFGTPCVRCRHCGASFPAVPGPALQARLTFPSSLAACGSDTGHDTPQYITMAADGHHPPGHERKSHFINILLLSEIFVLIISQFELECRRNTLNCCCWGHRDSSSRYWASCTRVMRPTSPPGHVSDQTTRTCPPKKWIWSVLCPNQEAYKLVWKKISMSETGNWQAKFQLSSYPTIISAKSF